MPLKWMRKVILLKNEGSYAVDASPVPATDAMLVRNVAFRPLQLAYEDREYDVPHFGNKGRIIAARWSELAFEVEMAGSGAAGTAPKYGAALKSCMLSETINAGVSVVYAPISSGEVSSSIYFRMDGREHKMLGCYGNVEARLARGRVPVFAFSFVGLHVQPTDTALGTPTLGSFQKPLAVNKVNTTPFTLHAFAGKFRELSINLGNQLPFDDVPNFEGVRFVGRSARGAVRLEDELIATKDWWTIIKAETLGALAVTQGTVAGNRVAFAAANVQITQPEIAPDNNLSMLGCGLEFLPSAAGNDELSITFT